MKKYVSLIVALVMVLSMGTAAFAGEEPDDLAGIPQDRCCEHTYSYRIQDDSYEATDTAGGYRHYICIECGAEYAYSTDPLIYEDGFVKQDGTVVEVNETSEGAVNPNLPLWDHIPDGEPHVFWSRSDLEWRVYIYGDHDITSICSDDQVLWSAPVYDLSDWRYDGEIIRVPADPFEPGTGDAASSGGEEGANEEADSAGNADSAGDADSAGAEGNADSAGAEGEAESSGDSGESSGEDARTGSLFAPDCEYDRLTDSFILITFENGKRCAMYRADNPAGRFDDEEPIFSFATGFALSAPEEGVYYLTDPAILIEEDGTAYVLGNINSGVITDEAAKQEMLANGESGIAIFYKLLRDEDAQYYVAEIGYGGTTNGPENYVSMFEGISICKDPDTGMYILLYCSSEYTGETGTGTTSSGLAFAYSDDPMGKWTYGSNGMNGADIYEGLPHVGGGNYGNVLYENSGRHEIDPLTGEMIFHTNTTYMDGNDHGGIVKINGKWYVFGHRQSGNGNAGRTNTIQKISLEYQEDGSLVIPVAEMTSTGAADSISAYHALDTGTTCYLVPGYGVDASRSGPYVVNYLGNSDPDTNEGKDFDVTHYSPIENIKDGSIAGFKYLDFAEGGATAAGILVSGEEGYADGIVQIWLDAPVEEAGGKQIGELNVSTQSITDAPEKETGTDGTEWSWLTCELSDDITGIHAVYYVFASDAADTNICRMDQIRFAR